MRTCIECNKEIRGRIDKKFCSTECRTSYNNHLYRQNQASLLWVNKILRKNYKILSEFCDKREFYVSYSLLSNLGFNFNFFTSLGSEIANSNVRIFCYDISYLIEGDRVDIKREVDFMPPK